MFGPFGARKWSDLPGPFLEVLQSKLGPDFASLKSLATRHNILGQRLLRSKAFLKSEPNFQVPTFAFLLGSLGSQEAQREHFDDAELALNLCLRLKEEDSPAHTGLANLYYLQGKYEEARRHALEGLAVTKIFWSDDIPAEIASEDSLRASARGLAQILGSVELASRLDENSAEVLDLVMAKKATEKDKVAMLAQLDAIVDDPNENNIQGYLNLVAEKLHLVGWELRGALSGESRVDPNADFVTQRWAPGVASIKYFEPMMRAFLAAKSLSPDFLDVHVTLAHVRYENYLQGMGWRREANQYASEAVALLDRHLSGDKGVVVYNQKLVTRPGKVSFVHDALSKIVAATD
jgi:tetratricopeptide (TPR) repeat protein